MRVLTKKLRVEIKTRVFLKSLNFEIKMRVSQKSADRVVQKLWMVVTPLLVLSLLPVWPELLKVDKTHSLNSTIFINFFKRCSKTFRQLSKITTFFKIFVIKNGTFRGRGTPENFAKHYFFSWVLPIWERCLWEVEFFPWVLVFSAVDVKKKSLP